MDIIVLNGPAGSGKDLIAEQLMAGSLRDCLHIKFAKPLRVRACAIFGIPDSDLEEYKDDKSITAIGLTIRETMIRCALELKKEFGAGALGKIAAELVPWDSPNTLIITDAGGFQEEYWDFIKGVAFTAGWKTKMNVSVIKLKRDGCSFEGDSRQYFEDSDLTSPIDCLHYLGSATEYRVIIDEISNNGTIDELMLEVHDTLSLYK